MPSQIEILESAIKAAISRAIDAGSLSGQTPEAIKLERPKDRDHGDYASSIALQLAKPAGMNPREVAQIIADQLIGVDGISKVDIAGPGFINITLNRASQAALVETILKSTKDFGKGNALAGVKINLEFISANPTGPLHLGHTRWAAVGDALGRVLTAAGAQVTREFYINDRGNQMDYFGQSVEAVALGNPVPGVTLYANSSDTTVISNASAVTSSTGKATFTLNGGIAGTSNGTTNVFALTTLSSTTNIQSVAYTHYLYNDSITSGQMTVYLLPPSNHIGVTQHKKIGSTANVVLSAPNGATIDGQPTYTLMNQ